MKIATMRAVATSAALLLTAATLAGCANGANSTGAAGANTADASHATIGLLLPDSVTARYESADKPYFEAKVKELCADCKVLYANADRRRGQAAAAGAVHADPGRRGARRSTRSTARRQRPSSPTRSSKNVPVISYDRLIKSADSTTPSRTTTRRSASCRATALVDKLEEATASSPATAASSWSTVADRQQRGAVQEGRPHDHRRERLQDPRRVRHTGWDPAKAQDWVAGQITQFGDQIMGVYAANDGNGGGAIAALKAAGVNPLPPVTGQDAELAGLQRILAGDQFMTVYKAFKPEAEKAAEARGRPHQGRQADGDTTVDRGQRGHPVVPAHPGRGDRWTTSRTP